MSGKPNDKWLQTRIKNLGSREAVTEKMKEIGGRGGKNAYKVNPETGKALKGFALDRERASRAGKLGGTLSKRGKSNGVV